VSASVLTKSQQLELQKEEKAAMADMTKIHPTYPNAVAGAAFGGGIWAMLDSLFEELVQADQKMPEEFSLSISSDIPANVDATATAYLATDLYRPRAGWSLSAKKRALSRELQDLMDKRAWMAVLYLRRARNYLGFGRADKE
jgi:hypothetical protein